MSNHIKEDLKVVVESWAQSILLMRGGFSLTTWQWWYPKSKSLFSLSVGSTMKVSTFSQLIVPRYANLVHISTSMPQVTCWFIFFSVNICQVSVYKLIRNVNITCHLICLDEIFWVGEEVFVCSHTKILPSIVPQKIGTYVELFFYVAKCNFLGGGKILIFLYNHTKTWPSIPGKFEPTLSLYWWCRILVMSCIFQFVDFCLLICLSVLLLTIVSKSINPGGKLKKITKILLTKIFLVLYYSRSMHPRNAYYF